MTGHEARINSVMDDGKAMIDEGIAAAKKPTLSEYIQFIYRNKPWLNFV